MPCKQKKRIKSYKRKKKGGRRKTRVVKEHERMMKVVGDTAKLAIGAAAVTSIAATTVSALKR